ncbi:MAG: acyltransferase [Pseudomonadales bacterium]|nr:acyltransferase [Pseudomonadales bacterium]
MGSVKIGKGTAVGPKTVIISHSNDYTANTPITETYKTVDIEIGDDVFIGAGVVILPGTIIGDKAVIGAGAVVTKSVASGIVLAGVPGRKIGSRYEK